MLIKLPALPLFALHRIGLHFVIDPLDVVGDAGVDSGLVLHPAPIAPADHAHQSHPVIISADEGAPGIPLWLKNKTGKEKNKIRKEKFSLTSGL